MRVLRLLLIVGGATIYVACGGGSGAAPAASVPAATPASTPAALAPSGDPAVTVENAVQACREKNDDLLRAFVVVPVSETDVGALFAKGEDVRLALRQPSVIDGEHATVEVGLEIQRTGATESVARTWELERGGDGVWRFLELPDCY